eukprot:TRINITY_DN20018_c0_g1_i1.p1 TRINITY_DN20018_c0_g1~~TRINITY_DN20018_c0_g1_i1.p1  ORF type:complete len:456 (+),score=75.05 TRINITY_DN20018_c0_g1_i1:195-1562(+)
MFLTKLPGDPKALLGGFMIVSAFLSMFMSNTATSALMIPTAVTIYDEIRNAESKLHPEQSRDVTIEMGTQQRQFSGRNVEGGCPSPMVAVDTAVEMDLALAPASNEQSSEDENEEEENSDDDVPFAHQPRLAIYFKKVVLGIAYSCTVGGAATLTGTGPNLVFGDSTYELAKQDVSYGKWFLVGGAFSVAMLLSSFAVLAFMNGGLGVPRGYKIPTSILKERSDSLGHTTRDQIIVYLAFLATVAGWIMKGNHVFPKTYKNSTICMATGSLMFFIPMSAEQSSDDSDTEAKPRMILEWKRLQHQLPMNVVFLLGAGNAISLGFVKSGLSHRISNGMTHLEHLPGFGLMLINAVVAAGLSQVTSDVATAELLLPIAFQMARAVNIPALATMTPVCMACSLPFLLPISTPPNAIAFGTGLLETVDFIKNGWLLVFIGIGVSIVILQSYGIQILDEAI